MGVTISRSQLRRVCAKVTRSLDASYEELLAALPREALLNVDETGHPENGQRLWTGCFRAQLFTLFKIDPSRGSDVLLETLGTESTPTAIHRSPLRGCKPDVSLGESNCATTNEIMHLPMRSIRYL